MNLADNTILITGGTSGIGRALAEEFHQRGNQVNARSSTISSLTVLRCPGAGQSGLRR
jgi:uncharacterized oxidoreductase